MTLPIEMLGSIRDEDDTSGGVECGIFASVIRYLNRVFNKGVITKQTKIINRRCAAVSDSPTGNFP